MGEWVLDFESEMARHVDTPDEFLRAVGYFMAGAALANRVFVNSPGEITTNMYPILVSSPGWFRKSTPIRVGMRMLEKVIQKGEVLPSSSSIQALGKIIPPLCKNERGHGIFVYDELRDFSMHVKNEFAAPIVTLLVERFEQGMPKSFSRRSEEGTDTDTIPGGFVLSFIAPSTMTWLVMSMGEDDVKSGLFSRFLMIESHEKTREYELPPPFDWARLDALSKRLIEVREAFTRTEFFFRKDAERDYILLYRDINKTVHGHRNPDYSSMTARLPAYLKKLALLHAAISLRSANFILPDDIEAVAPMIFNSMDASSEIMEEISVGERMFGKNVLRVRKSVMARKAISKNMLLGSMYLRPRELDEILEVLMGQEAIKVERSDGEEMVSWIDKEDNPAPLQ